MRYLAEEICIRKKVEIIYFEKKRKYAHLPDFFVLLIKMCQLLSLRFLSKYENAKLS